MAIVNSRRKFVKRLGAATISAFALPSIFSRDPALFSGFSEKKADKLVIGIIGAENTHTVAYGRAFNVEKKFPGVKVGYVWGETEEFARFAMEAGSIPKMVKEPEDMLGKIDALIVDHRHGKYHLPAAAPFVERGIPTFIDKPFCYRANEGKDFLAMARKLGTAITSYSTIAHSRAMLDIKKQVNSYGKIEQVVMTGPVDIESKWGGVFYYGVHMIQQLMKIFGEDIKKVKITRDGGKANATLIYANGMPVTLIFSSFYSGWKIMAETETGYHDLKSRVWDEEPEMALADMVHMFRTGEEPRSHQSILNGVSILEALESSASNEEWVEVAYITL